VAVKTLAVAVFALLYAVCTEASADCWDEVATAFELLRTSGRPYRKEVTFVVIDQQTFHGTAEFLPPDRMREVTSNGVAGYGAFETIQVGQRAWSSPGGYPWSWREWDPSLMIFKADKDFSTLRDRPVPADTMFACLGKVEFNGTEYLGYRARLNQAIVAIAAPDGTLSETRQQELSRKLQQMPQEWRTVFVDPQSKLPAHDLVAQENQLDSPRSKVRYTYPNNIKIEPPLWCRIGLCSSGLW
jgi:hypothetical protein